MSPKKKPSPYPLVTISRAVNGIAFVHLIVGDWASATVAHGTRRECRGHKERLEWALRMLDRQRALKRGRGK